MSTGSVNKVVLIGRLGKDPEIRRTQDGKRIANLSVATGESWTDRSTGERQERTEWHRVAIYADVIAGIAEQYLRKGSSIYVEGKLQTRQWQNQNGEDRYTTEVALTGFNSALVMLDGPDSNRDARPAAQDGPESDFPGDRPVSQRTPVKRQSARADMSDMNDDIPFLPEWR